VIPEGLPDNVLSRGVAGCGPLRASEMSRIGQLAVAGKLMARSSPKGGDGFQCHLSSTLDCPLVILFEEDFADQTDDHFFIREDTDHFGSALDLAVDPQ